MSEREVDAADVDRARRYSEGRATAMMGFSPMGFANVPRWKRLRDRRSREIVAKLFAEERARVFQSPRAREFVRALLLRIYPNYLLLRCIPPIFHAPPLVQSFVGSALGAGLALWLLSY